MFQNTADMPRNRERIGSLENNLEEQEFINQELQGVISAVSWNIISLFFV